VPKAGYTATSGSVALSAATAQIVLNIIAPAQFGIDLRSISFGFDGVTAANTPVLWEICSSTQATAGTPGSTPTVNQVYGRAITAGFTAGAAYGASPATVLTVIDADTISPNGGLIIRDWPQYEGFDQDVSKGLCLRLTAAQTVNARATMKFERC
jgi:hypothetical protein